MYESEEEKLAEYKKKLDDVPVSQESLDEAIITGFQKARFDKKQKSHKKKWIISMATVAVILLAFVTSIRVSPVFANYVTSIPGMEKIVDLIRDDKGRMTALENNYYQEIDVTSQKKDGLEIVIDGAIADEKGMVLFYTLHADQKRKNMTINEAQLTGRDGEVLDLGSSSYGMPHISETGKKEFSGTLEYFFQTPLSTREFKLNLTVNGINEAYSIPFALSETLKKKKTYEINKTVRIEGQNIRFEEATVYPLRVALHVKQDPQNTKKLLNFDDIRLVDERGEAWSKIANGVTASHVSDNEAILYLQSNYFNEPKELYLVFNRIQAVDKDEGAVVVDLENEKIVKQPKGNKLRYLKIRNGEIRFDLHTNEEFTYSLFSEIKDEKGNEMESNSSFVNVSNDEGIMEVGVGVSSLDKYKSPIHLKLAFFPEWIVGNEKVRIK